MSNYPYPWNTDAPGPGQSTRRPIRAKTFICRQCGGLQLGGYAAVDLPQCSCNAPPKPEPKPKHDGDLGHNSTAFYEDDGYITSDGEIFYVKSVILSDKMRRIALIPKEALSLLAWLEQERETLEHLAKEQKG